MRHKNTFKEDFQLQADILNDRLVNCLTIQEISVKYPQYSMITYKRFFGMVLSKEESKQIQRIARKRRRKIASDAQKRRFN